MRAFLASLWAAPGTAIGLLLAPLFRRRRIVNRVLLCEGASWPRRIGWRYRAMTLGEVVLCADDIDPGTFGHELAHVDQYRRWGPAFIPAYLAASLWSMARGRGAYRGNAFEVAARRAAAAGRSSAG